MGVEGQEGPDQNQQGDGTFGGAAAPPEVDDQQKQGGGGSCWH